MEGLCLTLVALKADAVRSCVLLQLLSCSEVKAAPWMGAPVFLAGGTVRVEFRYRRVALVTLVADLRLSSCEE